MKKTDQEVKAEIMVAASRLFIKYGYSKTTMEDIAKAVRKGKSTLYYYYKSKDDIIIDLLDNEATAILQKIRQQSAFEVSAVERFRTYFRVITEEAEILANIYNLLRLELKDDYNMQKRMTTIYDDLDQEVISDILIYGIERGEFRSITKNDIKEVASLIDNIVLDLIIKLLLEQVKDDWQKSLNLLGEIVIRGLI